MDEDPSRVIMRKEPPKLTFLCFLCGNPMHVCVCVCVCVCVGVCGLQGFLSVLQMFPNEK